MSSLLIHSSESEEWETPRKYIVAAREVMGRIDLDPASSADANLTVQAGVFFDVADNGLNQFWVGNIWLNPPYGRMFGRSLAGIWIDKLLEEYENGGVEQAILLVNSVTDRKWFKPLWDHTICFVYKRICFLDPYTLEYQNSPTHGNVFVYFGKYFLKFRDVFQKFGHIVIPH